MFSWCRPVGDIASRYCEPRHKSGQTAVATHQHSHISLATAPATDAPRILYLQAWWALVHDMSSWYRYSSKELPQGPGTFTLASLFSNYPNFVAYASNTHLNLHSQRHPQPHNGNVVRIKNLSLFQTLDALKRHSVPKSRTPTSPTKKSHNPKVSAYLYPFTYTLPLHL